MHDIPEEPATFGIYYSTDNYYQGKFPRFYDTNQFSWVKKIESQWETMRDEITEYLNSGTEFKGSISPNSPGISYPDAWKRMYFMNSLWIQFSNCKKLPKTWGILKTIPGVTQASVLILNPHSQIYPHSSESNINIRCHLGIKIPGKLPVCGLRVGNEEENWSEGSVIMFSDCHEHTVWNNTDQMRIIVAFDILQKQYASQRIWLCAMYLSALTIRSTDSYLRFLKKTPNFLIKTLHIIIACPWYCYIFIQNKLEIDSSLN